MRVAMKRRKSMNGRMSNDADWRSHLRRDIGWLLLAKLGLLTLLWALFFSSSHQCRADGAATAQRLAVAGESGGHRCD